MGKHNARDKSGRFTSSGAPIPSDDGQGDPSAYEHVDAISGRPGEDPEMFAEFHASYPTHDFARGPVHRLIPHRNAVEIDGETGEALREIPDHELRARVPDLRTQAHLAAAEGDPFAENLMGARHGEYPETRSYRRTPGADGYKVPSMGQSDREAEWRG